MSDTPKRPDEGESTLAGEPVSAWSTVQNPVPLPPQPQILPPPVAASAAPGGYRPVFDGRPQSGAPGDGYGGTVYGGPQGAPPNYGQAPYGQQGYPQNNNATDAVGLLATWWMMRRARLGLKLLLVLPALFVVLLMVFVMHGCLNF